MPPASNRATTRPGRGSSGSSASTASSFPGAISLCAHIGAEPIVGLRGRVAPFVA